MKVDVSHFCTFHEILFVRLAVEVFSWVKALFLPIIIPEMIVLESAETHLAQNLQDTSNQSNYLQFDLT